MKEEITVRVWEDGHKELVHGSAIEFEAKDGKMSSKNVTYIPKEIELQQAINVLCKALKVDKTQGSYYWSWRANIATAFQDCSDKYDGSETIHHVSNEAAANFLDMLININGKQHE